VELFRFNDPVKNIPVICRRSGSVGRIITGKFTPVSYNMADTVPDTFDHAAR
jgi:hypothetical protein